MSENRLDVTSLVVAEEPDGDCLPLIKCLCGTEFKPWDFVISYDIDDSPRCHVCRRRFVFNLQILIYEV